MKKPTVAVPERCEEEQEEKERSVREREREREISIICINQSKPLFATTIPIMHLRFYEGNV